MAIVKLPEAELRVMNCIWAMDGQVTSAAVAKNLNHEKEWSLTTILTFLSRLAEKGFLKVHKDGKQNVYEVVIPREDYVKSESRSFLEQIHSGSVTSLVACLYGSNSISKEDLDELRKYINRSEWHENP